MLTDDLKIVIPVRENIHVYHTPISEAVFRANFKILAATKAALFEKGLTYAADVGVQIAALTLEDEGRQESIKRGDPDGDMGAGALLEEIKRLTLVLVPTQSGWDHIPVESAIRDSHINNDEWQETLSQLVFFTCLYALTPSKGRREVVDAVAGILNASITSSAPTEWNGTSPMSTTDETSSPPERSSVPS